MITDEEIIKEMMESVPSHRNIFSTLEVKKLEERVLNWHDVNENIDYRFKIRELDLNDLTVVDQTALIFRLGFPELFGGVYQDILFPSRYAEIANQMKIFVLMDSKKDMVASAWALTPSQRNMSVEFSLVVTNPDYRGSGLCTKFTQRIDKLVEESGAEYGLVYCAPFHRTTQRIFRELGFKKTADLKGFILANVGNGNYARDNVVMMSKFYNNAERLCPL